MFAELLLGVRRCLTSPAPSTRQKLLHVVLVRLCEMMAVRTSCLGLRVQRYGERAKERLIGEFWVHVSCYYAQVGPSWWGWLRSKPCHSLKTIDEHTWARSSLSQKSIQQSLEDKSISASRERRRNGSSYVCANLLLLTQGSCRSRLYPLRFGARTEPRLPPVSCVVF